MLRLGVDRKPKPIKEDAKPEGSATFSMGSALSSTDINEIMGALMGDIAGLEGPSEP